MEFLFLFLIREMERERERIFKRRKKNYFLKVILLIAIWIKLYIFDRLE